MPVNRFQLAVKRAVICFASTTIFSIVGCSSDKSSDEGASNNQQDSVIVIDRTLSAQDIDPAIYFNFDDPSDPFHEVYAAFRARRANDMADASKPPPIESYESVHLTRNMPWNALEEVLPFDWASLRRESPVEAAQLERVIKARLAFDHPDIKITQLMIGPGATLPAHAGGSPGFYHVIGGSGEISVEGETQTVSPGTTVKLNPYDVRRIYATPGEPLKVLWIRWAPDGDQQYLAAGYYLTGANQHIQPVEGVLPQDYQYWGERLSTEPVPQPASPLRAVEGGSSSAAQATALAAAREKLGEKRNPYPAAPTFSHESDSPWLTKGMEANFFWAKDINSLGALLDRWVEVMRYKALFQATRPDGGWDFNISQMVWGPRARYVEHSHSIPEFYYMMSGPVEHWIGEQKYLAMPGDIFMTNSYVPHQSRGIVDDLPFRNIGASWAPNGNREVFNRPFYLVEPLQAQPEGAVLGAAPRFH